MALFQNTNEHFNPYWAIINSDGKGQEWARTMGMRTGTEQARVQGSLGDDSKGAGVCSGPRRRTPPCTEKALREAIRGWHARLWHLGGI